MPLESDHETPRRRRIYRPTALRTKPQPNGKVGRGLWLAHFPRGLSIASCADLRLILAPSRDSRRPNAHLLSPREPTGRGSGHALHHQWTTQCRGFHVRFSDRSAFGPSGDDCSLGHGKHSRRSGLAVFDSRSWERSLDLFYLANGTRAWS